MLKYLICGAVALGAFSTLNSAQATGVIVNGQHHSGGTITVPYGNGQPTTASGPCCGNIELHDTGVIVSEHPSYEAAPIQPAAASDLVYIDPAPQPVPYQEPVVVTTPVAPAPPVITPAVVTTPAPAHPPMMKKHHHGHKKHRRGHKDGHRGWGSKVYVGARGGWTRASDTDFALQGGSVDNEYSNRGYNISAVAGWRNRVSPNFGYRVELEGGYQTVEVDRHRAGPNTFSGSNASGDTGVLYGFLNGYVDVPLAHRISAIAGGGIGIGRVNLDGHGVGPVGVVMDDSDTVFGYNIGAGLSYDVTNQLALEAMYRYMSFMNAELRSADGVTSDVDVDSHNVTIGARYGF